MYPIEIKKEASQMRILFLLSSAVRPHTLNVALSLRYTITITMIFYISYIYIYY